MTERLKIIAQQNPFLLDIEYILILITNYVSRVENLNLIDVHHAYSYITHPMKGSHEERGQQKKTTSLPTSRTSRYVISK